MSHNIGESTRKALRELGLTGYESAVYLSLLERGVMTASAVSAEAGVPFSKVYEVLNSLGQKGWVDIERGRPSRYFAKPPTEALEEARRKLEGQVRTWEHAVKEELQPLYDKRELREKPDIWILRGETSVLTKLQEMLGQAQSQVMIAAPLFAQKLATLAVPAVASLRSEIDVQVMVAGHATTWGLERLGEQVQVRERDNLFGGGMIVDGREALLLLGEDKPSLVVWSNHIGLVKFAKDYFQHLWNSSTKPRTF